MFEILIHPEGKVMVSITGDHLRDLIPSEIEEIIDDHNDTLCEDSIEQAIDIDKWFNENGVYTFNLSPDQIKIKKINEVNTKCQQ